MATMIRELARASGADAEAIADGFGFDLATDTIPATARFVTAPGYVTVNAVAQSIGWPPARLSTWLAPRSSRVEQVVVPGAVETLAGLSAAGLALGILTNADEAEAMRHLDHMGATPYLHRVIGHDSGFGAKPDPRGAADFADRLGLQRAEVLLVGDGFTDMDAAQGAGLVAVGVLTGTLDRAALAPRARAVLPDLTHVPGWMQAEGLAAG